eukprot:gnl/TRDRNA2_/TRDRNA2_194617_c0_seq1.p1 gnl/TRDRNA2_/TRDRNA2_194617_c0~~gnl/TRDRNA2_/TRDRNA2_194617_c0_seq1.p1  ORF type:complete len:516 (+),score=157.76 gnl/TRDRNA2_/TRDRNA2_194617_c0_seq1:72-1550(+)
MACTAARTALLCAAACVSFTAGMVELRGVNPQDMPRYEPKDNQFRCFDGTGSVAISGVNDEICDCADGSDEPGTAACAGQVSTFFYCPNVGSTPRQLYSSRVDDGMCDCCDGSDEAGLAARHPSKACKNTCKELGEKDQATRKAKHMEVSNGLAAKEDIETRSKEKRASFEKELAEQEASVPDLEKKVEELKAAKAAYDATTTTTTTTAPLNAPEGEEAELNVQLGKSPEVKKGSERAAETQDADGAEKPQVSEYAKWMDKEGAEKAKEEEKPQVSEYTKWMDKEGAEKVKEGSGEEAEDSAGDEGGDDGEEEDVEASDEGSGGEDSDDDLEPWEGGAKKDGSPADPLKDAEDKLRKTKDSVSKLQKKIAALAPENLGFGDLLDMCLERKIDQYNYKICFFDSAKQDSVTLGRWDGWTGPNSAQFDHGQHCPGGQARKLAVNFVCGPEQEIEEITEPSMCSYEALVQHPGACTQKHVDEALTPPIIGPHEEL